MTSIICETAIQLVLCKFHKSVIWQIHKQTTKFKIALNHLNNKLLNFFQIDQVQPKTISIPISGLADNSVVTFSAREYSSTCIVYPDQLLNLPLTGSFTNLTNIKFEHLSFSSSVQQIFILPFLQKLSFVMSEFSHSLMNSVTESPCILSNLTYLEFDSCYNLTELPSEICNIVHLQNLSITNCHELEALPEKLGSLLELEIMNLRCCTKLQELPESIGSLRNLRFLDVSDCLNISVLPEEIGELCGLRVLKMSGAHGLHELPESMRKLSQLEEVICDEETSYLWTYFETDLYNLKINLVEEDRFESFMKIVH